MNEPGVYDLALLAQEGGDVDSFTVCLPHAELTGLVRDMHGTRWQGCRDCHPDLEVDRALWPGDFAMLVELCHTCAARLVRTGTRWSPLHCDPCRQHWVKERKARRPHPPLGRHSLVNQLPGATPTEVAASLKLMVGGIQTLDVVRQARVASVIDRPTPLADYLDRARATDLTEARQAVIAEPR